MRRSAWSPARQMGWYRERNQRICELIRQGEPIREVAFKYNLTERSVNMIVKALSDSRKEDHG